MIVVLASSVPRLVLGAIFLSLCCGFELRTIIFRHADFSLVLTTDGREQTKDRSRITSNFNLAGFGAECCRVFAELQFVLLISMNRPLISRIVVATIWSFCGQKCQILFLRWLGKDLQSSSLALPLHGDVIIFFERTTNKGITTTTYHTIPP